MLNHKIKGHRGRGPKTQTWTLGILDCSTKPGKGIVKIIKNKSAAVIIPLNLKHVRPGSIIHTDEAAPSKPDIVARPEGRHLGVFSTWSRHEIWSK